MRVSRLWTTVPAFSFESFYSDCWHAASTQANRTRLCKISLGFTPSDFIAWFVIPACSYLRRITLVEMQWRRDSSPGISFVIVLSDIHIYGGCHDIQRNYTHISVPNQHRIIISNFKKSWIASLSQILLPCSQQSTAVSSSVNVPSPHLAMANY